MPPKSWQVWVYLYSPFLKCAFGVKHPHETLGVETCHKSTYDEYPYILSGQANFICVAAWPYVEDSTLCFVDVSETIQSRSHFLNDPENADISCYIMSFPVNFCTLNYFISLT